MIYYRDAFGAACGKQLPTPIHNQGLNWEADSGNQWTIPFGGGVWQDLQNRQTGHECPVQAFYNVEKPDNGPDWTLRLQLQFLFPK